MSDDLPWWAYVLIGFALLGINYVVQRWFDRRQAKRAELAKWGRDE